MVSENTCLNQYNKQSISVLNMERTEKKSRIQWATPIKRQ